MKWFTSFIDNCREHPALAFGILAALIAAGVFTGGAIYAPVIFAGIVTAGAVIAGLFVGWFSFAMGDKMGSKPAGLVMGVGAGLATGFSVALNPLIGMIVCGMAVSSVCGFLARALGNLIWPSRRDSTQVSQSPKPRKGSAGGSSASSSSFNHGPRTALQGLFSNAAEVKAVTNAATLAADDTIAARVARSTDTTSGATAQGAPTLNASAAISADPEAQAAAQLEKQLYGDGVIATTTPAPPRT